MISLGSFGLYLGFAYESPLWRRVGQERQGTGQIAKVGYRTGLCHERRTTGQDPEEADGHDGSHMETIQPRWELQLWNCLKGNAYD